MSETNRHHEVRGKEVKNDIKMYQEMDFFAKVFYPRLVALLNELEEKPTPEIVQSAKWVGDFVAKSTILSIDFYNKLLEDGKLGKQLSHDLGSPASSISMRVGGLSRFNYASVSEENVDRFTKAVKSLCKNCPRYVLTLQDILLRRIEAAGEKVEFAPFNTDFADAALTDFRNGSEVGGRAKNLFGVATEPGDESLPLQHFPTLKENEKITVPTGTVVNGLFNIMRNASKEAVDVSRATCEISRVGSEMIIRIVDDGIGIAGDKLPSIFEKGVSFTESTGLGLANLDTRLAQHGATLIVASRERKPQSGGAISFGETHIYPENPTEAARLSSILADRDSATVFEIRLPIMVE